MTKNWNDTLQSFEKLCGTIAALRHPQTGCPWDLKQTHETLRKYMIEEAYEAADVMHPLDVDKFKDELGDVLLQVVLNSQIASDDGRFEMRDVIENLTAKMIRRHPHVFDTESKKLLHSDQVRDNWEQIKKTEKKSENCLDKRVFAAIKPGNFTPALTTAVAIGKIAKKIQFDWDGIEGVLKQFESEVDELKEEINKGAKERIYSEMGDVLFSIGQLCRHLDIDPEVCAMDGNKKFLDRFKALETLATKKGIDPATAGTKVLETLWLEAKKLEKSGCPPV